MRFRRSSLLLLLVLSWGTIANAQWFDGQSVKATVLIERRQGDAVVPHGTGFLVWNYSSPDSPYVVTCAHLLNRDQVYLRLNADSSLVRAADRAQWRIIKIGERTWELAGQTLRTEVDLRSLRPRAIATDSLRDIGVFKLDVGSAIQVGPQQEGVLFADAKRIPSSGIRKRHDLALGDELYFVGFPLGIGTGRKLEPVIRSGSVAWLSLESDEFLIDALSYGGNSGSPVFSKAIFGRTRGEASWDAPYLVGMVIGHVGQDVNGVLTQPDPKQLVFERQFVSSNFGLVRCVWIDDILEVIGRLRASAVPDPNGAGKR